MHHDRPHLLPPRGAVRRHVFAGLTILAVATALPAAGWGRPDAQEPGAPAVLLSIAGRTNSTPSIAASGSTVAVAWGASTPAGRTDVYLAMSADGGATFGSPVRVNAVSGEARLGGEMPPRVALTPAAGGQRPAVSVLWTAKGRTTTIKLARSADGRSFAAPESLPSAGAPGDRGWAALAVGSDGRPRAIWLDHRGLARLTAGQGDPHAAMSGGSALYFAAAAGRDRPLAVGVCYCCKTTLAAGPDGQLLAAWRHVYPGDQRDIAFAVSRDGGRTFSAPTPVSHDHWSVQACPDDGPAAAFDQQGNAHIIWPTMLPEGDRGALFYATTTDGKAFSPRQQVPTLGSPRPTHPQIAVDGDNRVWVAWDELQGTRRVAVVSQVTGDANPTFGAPIELEAGPRAAYPVLASAGSTPVAAWVSGTGADGRIAVRRLTPP